MKRPGFYLLLSSLALSLSGCDLMNMPSKMDETNATTSSMNSKMTQTNDQMAKTNHHIDLQTLLVSLSEMYKDVNTRMLSPVPFDMFPGGKTFAEEANESDLVDLFYSKYKRLGNSTPDTEMQVVVPLLKPVFDENGNKVFEAQYTIREYNGNVYAKPVYTGEFPKAYIDLYNHDLDIVFNLMQVVAAFIPQPMIENVVVKQIGKAEFSKDGSGGGLREDTAYLILNLRDVFIRGALLKASLYEDHLKNMDQAREALKLVDQLDYIASRPYVDKIAKTEIMGFMNISENYVYAMQAKASEFSKIEPVKLTPEMYVQKEDGSYSFTSAFVPVRIDNDPMAAMNNPNLSTYFRFNEDGLTVTPNDQSAMRTKSIQYNPKRIAQDWKDLQSKMRSLSAEDQASSEARAIQAKIQAHLH
jgi:hypothetical protein